MAHTLSSHTLSDPARIKLQQALDDSKGMKNTVGFHGLQDATGAHSRRLCPSIGLSPEHLQTHGPTPNVTGRVLATARATSLTRENGAESARRKRAHQDDALWRQLRNGASPPAPVIFGSAWGACRASTCGAVCPKCSTRGGSCSARRQPWPPRPRSPLLGSLAGSGRVCSADAAARACRIQRHLPSTHGQ